MARVLAVTLLVCAWVIGAVATTMSVLFFGPSFGCPMLSLPVGSHHACDGTFWVTVLEVFLVLGFYVAYLVVAPLLTFSRMITWASSNRVHNSSP